MFPKIQNLSPCDGWFYVAHDDGKDIIFRVAAWAVRDDGQVVGMISASGAVTDEKIPRLVTPPSIGGMYLHRDSLSDSQLKQAVEGSKPRTFR